ncbi:hypothetical protein [Microbispora bryophytorum]|uniref:hypothetical protein n=1 Tax=Microbispora bryophytorum TaxID=1460882 RepID=UPI0033C75ED4
MAGIGYIEAWQLWLNGKSTAGYDLFGLPVLWWARAGKISAFLGGMTVVLDLIGPERLRVFGERAAKSEPDNSKLLWILTVAAFVVGALVFYWIPRLVEWGLLSDDRRLRELTTVGGVFVAVILIGGWYSRPVIRGFAWLLASPRFEPVLRWLAVAAVIIGFHFDLLAS